MKIIEVKDYKEMSETACSLIINKVKKIENPVLGLATGSTPEGLYRCIVKTFNDENLSFQKFKTFNLDEYMDLDKNNPNSYYYFMQTKLFKDLDIPNHHIHVPNGKADDFELECKEYEKKISEAGKIDIQLLGIGVNGHIGFNEPGTAFTSRTHVVQLDESTRQANSRYFSSIDEVPTQAITMGIETIMESKEIILLVSGKQKAHALSRLLNGEVSEEFPASVLKRHPNFTIIADEEAREKIGES
jgi:glucosamine-6-phosphate deaminase